MIHQVEYVYILFNPTFRFVVPRVAVLTKQLNHFDLNPFLTNLAPAELRVPNCYHGMERTINLVSLYSRFCQDYVILDTDMALAEVLQQWGMIVIPANLKCWGIKCYVGPSTKFCNVQGNTKKRNKSPQSENASQSPVIVCLVWTAA